MVAGPQHWTMRRIYESRALERDDDDPFSPNETDGEERSTAALHDGESRTVDWQSFSHAFMPVALRDYAIVVDVSTGREEYRVGETVEVDVRIRNRLPVPVSIRTETRELWTWAVDGLTDASTLEEPRSEQPNVMRFGRGERKRFTRRWPQRIRVSEREWEPTGTGEYAISAGLNVADAADRGLSDETTVRVVE